jgi:hypothetical protein
MVFLTITVAYLPNGCVLVETILKDSILFVLMALTGIMGCMCTPMLLTQRTAFLKSHLLGDLVVAGISTLLLAFPVLSSGFLRAFFCGLFLGIGIHYNFFNVLKNNQELPNTRGKHFFVKIVLVLPRLRTHAKEKAR